MNELDSSPSDTGGAAKVTANTESSFLTNDWSSATNDTYRIAELEMENSRLQRLVAELLIKNQQLRRPG
jgi:hypothetical protein